MTSLTKANALALAIPATLMAGALGSQYFGGLFPCEMCHWQRWPHYGAIVLALIAFALKPPARTAVIALAALAILVSGGIGVFHAGVEYRFWPGPAHCTGVGAGSIADILKAPIVSCDVPQWTLFGVSLAGFNALISIAGGLAVLAMLRRAR